MYIYIHTHTAHTPLDFRNASYLCVCIYILYNMYIYIHTHTAHTPLDFRNASYLCVFVCVCVCVCVCVFVCVLYNIYTHTNTHGLRLENACLSKCILYTYIYIYTHTLSLSHTHTHTPIISGHVGTIAGARALFHWVKPAFGPVPLVRR